MSEDSSSDANVRRSKRIAAKADDSRPQLMDAVLDELDQEDSPPVLHKKASSSQAKKKFYKNNFNKSKSEASGTLFDQGLKAVSIIGATSVNDEAKGTEDICYLVKYDNGQFELVLNSVAHKFCPMLIIDFLESRINFREGDEITDLSQELFADSNQLSNLSTNLSDITDSQLAHLDTSNRSLEI